MIDEFDLGSRADSGEVCAEGESSLIDKDQTGGWGVMRVLIVDDSEPMRRMIKTYLADLVGETFECGDGSEALTAYREHQPDFVLMDLKMTAMDGLDATRQIRQVFPKARIVIVSQWEDPPLREAALLAGAEAYVGKADLLPLRQILSETD